MKALRALLADRRRSQRGSVLSAVLIIVAFLSIIAGALMTELSTNFLLSNALVNRVGAEATVNSAMELALDRLQSTPLISGCPGAVSAITLNGRTAAASYASCWPTVDVRSQRYTGIAGPGTFNIDGTHSVIPGTGQDLYVVGDPAGTIYSYQFGQSAPIWSRDLQSNITGPPMAMQDAYCPGTGLCPDVGDPGTHRNADITYLIPIAGGSSDCPANACVLLLGQDVPDPPDVTCYLPTNASVRSRPAAGLAFPTLAYFGDSGGTLYAYNATERACRPGPAAPVATQNTPGNAAIVAGPIVFKNGNRDEIYVITSNGRMLHYTYKQSGLSGNTDEGEYLQLPYANAVGVAVETINGVADTSPPARVAISFAGGGVAIIRIDTNYDPSVGVRTDLGTSIAGPPSWCSCPGGQQIGVAVDGNLFVRDPNNLNAVSSYAGGSRIRAAPASDQVGEWFFGADDGYLHEVQQTPGSSTMVEVARYGGLGNASSAVNVAGCPAGICIYLGTSSNAYLVALNARAAKITACLSDAPPACSSDNPRLWAKVEVGSAGAPRTVHVQGWSYYSP